jgi:hypothetical protein
MELLSHYRACATDAERGKTLAKISLFKLLTTYLPKGCGGGVVSDDGGSCGSSNFG